MVRLRRRSPRCYTSIIGSVLLPNLHPHLKLGFLLVVAATLLVSGTSATFLARAASDRLDLSESQYGWLATAGGF